MQIYLVKNFNQELTIDHELNVTIARADFGRNYDRAYGVIGHTPELGFSEYELIIQLRYGQNTQRLEELIFDCETAGRIMKDFNIRTPSELIGTAVIGIRRSDNIVGFEKIPVAISLRKAIEEYLIKK